MIADISVADRVNAGDVEWRKSPLATVTKEGDKTYVTATCRVYTNSTHAPHDTKGCECIRNYGVSIPVSGRRIENIRNRGGDTAVNLYLESLAERLKSLLMSDARLNYERAELEPISYVTDDFVPACHECQVAPVASRNDLCLGCAYDAWRSR